MTTAHPKTPTPSTQDQPTLKIQWYRLLDFLQSLYRRKAKEIASRKWGKNWRNCVRPGRTYTRVELSWWPKSQSEELEADYGIRPEPGWEWHCPNCHDYSLITESMMPEILREWQASVSRVLEIARTKGIEHKPTPRPTAATAGCPNCKYRPGAPE